MLGQANQMLVNADLAYRRERITRELHSAREPHRARQLRGTHRPLSQRWPFGLISPNRRRPRVGAPKPSPHHVTSH